MGTTSFSKLMACEFTCGSAALLGSINNDHPAMAAQRQSAARRERFIGGMMQAGYSAGVGSSSKPVSDSSVYVNVWNERGARESRPRAKERNHRGTEAQRKKVKTFCLPPFVFFSVPPCLCG
jgi:hypothetical protein